MLNRQFSGTSIHISFVQDWYELLMVKYRLNMSTFGWFWVGVSISRNRLFCSGHWWTLSGWGQKYTRWLPVRPHYNMWGTVHSNVAMEHAPFTVDFSQLATSIQFGDFTACEVWLPESNAADPTRNHLSRGYENQIHLVVYCWVYKTSGPIVVPLGYLTVCYGTSPCFADNSSWIIYKHVSIASAK